LSWSLSRFVYIINRFTAISACEERGQLQQALNLLDRWLLCVSLFLLRVNLPASLQTLTFGQNFNQSLQGVGLPVSLSLSLSWSLV
jgi:hypothetical protein